MVNYFLILIYSIFSLFLRLIFDDGVTVNQKIPERIKPGEEFICEVKIKKENISGFAKLQLEIPDGFKAKAVETIGGNFTFNERTAKIIWTSLPSENEFVIKIAVESSVTAIGKGSVSGKFSYILNNTKQQIEFGPDFFEIGENNNASVANISNQTENKNTTENPDPKNNSKSETSYEKEGQISCKRKIIAVENEEFEVQFEIRKEGIKGFAKLIDKIPSGYQCAGIQTGGGSFSCFENSAKFVWVALPAIDVMNVSYRLIPLDPGQNTPGTLTGEFSYLQNEQTIKLDIPTENLPINDKNNPETIAKNDEPINNAKENNPTEKKTENPEKSENKEPVTMVKETSPPSNETKTEVAIVQTETNEEKNLVEKNQMQKNSDAGSAAGKANSISNQPTSNALTFSVQIGAFKNNISTSSLSKRYGLSDKIRSDQHEGYTKFLVGNFEEYKSAKEKRENIKQKGVSDAFITAYNSGKRITVQEALMISNQTWLK